LIGILLRPAVQDDEGFLFDLYASARQAELASVPWPAAMKDSFLRMQFDAQRTHYRTHFPRAEHSIILCDDARAGRIYVDRQESQILIVDLTLLPEFHRRGIGHELIGALQSEAAPAGKALSGHVERWNPAAHFWRRMGFEITPGAEGDMYDRIYWKLS
jgi:GNAT superfamily N-acetyltransferase